MPSAEPANAVMRLSATNSGGVQITAPMKATTHTRQATPHQMRTRPVSVAPYHCSAHWMVTRGIRTAAQTIAATRPRLTTVAASSGRRSACSTPATTAAAAPAIATRTSRRQVRYQPAPSDSRVKNPNGSTVVESSIASSPRAFWVVGPRPVNVSGLCSPRLP
jgi:hypothetical protein